MESANKLSDTLSLEVSDELYAYLKKTEKLGDGTDFEEAKINDKTRGDLVTNVM